MEYWDIYKKDRTFTGNKKGKYEIWDEGEYHLGCEVWIVNSKKEILIQKRSDKCAILPGKWAMTTGRIVSGETTLKGSIRELKEELGIKVDEEELIFINTYINLDIIWDIYFIKKDINLDEVVLQEEEVSEVKLASVDEIKDMLKNNMMYKYEEIYDLLDIVDKSQY